LTNIVLFFLILLSTHFIQLMKGKALRKHSLHEKTAASVLLKLFISGKSVQIFFTFHTQFIINSLSNWWCICNKLLTKYWQTIIFFFSHYTSLGLPKRKNLRHHVLFSCVSQPKRIITFIFWFINILFKGHTTDWRTTFKKVFADLKLVI